VDVKHYNELYVDFNTKCIRFPCNIWTPPTCFANQNQCFYTKKTHLKF